MLAAATWLVTPWNLAGAARAQPFHAVVVFGDSLSDPGNTADLQNRQAPPPLQYPEGTNFSTNPDWVWTQHLEKFYGGPGEHRSLEKGGTNHAMGGACISTDPDSTKGCSQQGSTQSQIMGHLADRRLAEHDGADPDSLYVLWGGANDLNLVGSQGSLTAVGQALALGSPSAVKDSIHGLSEQLDTLSRRSRKAALDYLQQIKFLQDQGAETIVVLNMPPLGLAPGIRGISEALSNPPAGLEGLIGNLVSGDPRLGGISTFINDHGVHGFNQTLAHGLKKLGHGIVAIDAHGFVERIAEDPERHGLTNVTQAACRQTPAFTSGFSELPFFNDACGAAQDGYGYPYVYGPGANATHLFADNVHPSGAANRLLADLVIAALSAAAPGSLAATQGEVGSEPGGEPPAPR